MRKKNYRPQPAQHFHDIVMDYIRKGDSTKFNSQLEQIDSSVLCQLSINACSHLIDALHLPYEILQEDTALAHERSTYLFASLLERARQIGKESLLFLLTPKIQ